MFEQLESGQLQLVPEVRARIAGDLAAVQFDEQGEPDLETVSDHLRAFARAYFLASESLGQTGNAETVAEKPESTAKSERIDELTRELFAHFERVFCAYTNSRPELFTKGQDFVTAIRALGRSWQNDRTLANRTARAGSNAMAELLKFYKKSGAYLFSATKELPGLKTVLGGTQSFTSASADAVRSMILYSDTVLVADPIYRWVEVDHEAEAFQFPRLLEDLLGILPLKPLIDAKLPIPSIVVFPSFEGTLDRKDVYTQDAQERMLMQFFGHYLNARFDDISEIFSYARRRSNETIEAILSSRLLVAPGATGAESFDTQLEIIRDNNRRFRSASYQESMNKLPPALLAVTTIMERLGPIYHMNENADALGASPLMSLPVHWHYYELLARASRDILTKNDALPRDIVDISKELTSRERCWFGNVPIDVLADLRMRGENLELRRKLGSAISELRASTTATVANNAVLVERALRQIGIEHNKELANLETRYRRTYTPMAIGGWLTIAASFLPFFPPITATAGVAALAGYLGAKAVQHMERYHLGRTLTGILAASARSR
ncbi:hypothetical protein [Nannocystis radixulma]|uniref:Uncharacterized protein n=1 Tax=Nannocystis radixulma TaxID=2995305 RepID=A0ABT5BPK2_9BACT|nr:hypothetical protein [Nannocystis radixulma]MDC0676096.1 hypothetical protein [Nannocystis radixulma]